MPLPLGLDREVFVRVAAILAAFFVVSNVLYSEPLLDLTIGDGSHTDPVKPSSDSAATPFFDINGHSISSAIDGENVRGEGRSTYIHSALEPLFLTLAGTILPSGSRDALHEHKDSDLIVPKAAVYRRTLRSIFNPRWITESLDEFLEMWRTATFSGMIAIIGGLIQSLRKLHKKKRVLTEEYEARLERQKYRLIDEYEAKLRDEMVKFRADFEPRLEQERRIAERAAYTAGEGLAKRIVKLQAKYKHECECTEARYQQTLEERVYIQQEYEEIIEDMGKTIQILTAEIGDKVKVVGGPQAIIDAQGRNYSGKDTTLEGRYETFTDWKPIIDKQTENIHSLKAASMVKDETIDDQKATIDKLTKDLNEKDAALKYRINAIAHLREEITDWEESKESTLEAYRKLSWGNQLLEQEETEWSKQVIRLRREVAEMLKENYSLGHEMWICNKKIATLEQSVASDRDDFMAALELAYASKRNQPQHESGKKHTKVEQIQPVPQIEVTRASIEIEGKLKTANKDGSASKDEAGLTGALPASKAKTIESGPAADTTNYDQMTAGATDMTVNENSQYVGKAQVNEKPEISSVSDVTSMDLLVLAAEVHTASQTSSMTEAQDAGSDTFEFIEADDNADTASGDGGHVIQYSKADETAAGGDGHGQKEVIVNTRVAKSSVTVVKPRKQVRHRGLRTPRTQCKSNNLRCDHHKIPCDNCFSKDLECSRQHPKEDEVSSTTHDSNKSVKPTKLAIKLKQDCNPAAPSGEIQQLLNNDICPICVKPGHKAAKCPEHLVFGKKVEAMKEEAKQDNTEPSTTASPESITEKTLANTADAESTNPTLQTQPVTSGKPTRNPGPLIVGLSDSEESPTETSKLSIDTDKSLSTLR